MAVKIRSILKKSQEELLEYCAISLLNRGYKKRNIIYTDDYLYAKGNIPILLVAHCDIVHKEIPSKILYDKQQKMLWSPTGIGGDDRCGVYAILKICEKYKPYVLFTTDEEIGCVGARKFTKEIKELPVNFIIEIDRRGNKQAVFYDCGNKEFQNYILSYDFDKKIGSYSDVCVLCQAYDVAGVNLSAGYYNEHTNTEYIEMKHLNNTIWRVEQILKDKEKHKYFDYQEIKYYYYTSSTTNTTNNKTTNTNYTSGNKNKKDKKDKKETNDEYWEKKAQDEYWEKILRKQEEEDDYWEKMLQKEDDYYDLSEEEWKNKYKTDKPANIYDIY